MHSALQQPTTMDHKHPIKASERDQCRENTPLIHLDLIIHNQVLPPTNPKPTSILSFTIRYSLSFISDQRFLAFALSITLGCSALRRMSRCSLTSRSTSRDSARTLLNSVWYLRVEFRVQGSGFKVHFSRLGSHFAEQRLVPAGRVSGSRVAVWYLTVESQGSKV